MSYEKTSFSRHLTVVFNLFVFLQIFNMLAARKIHDEINICEGIFGNFLYIAIVIIIIGGQIAIVQLGSFALKVHVEGLDVKMWLITVGVACTTLIWNLVLKKVP